MEAAGLGARRNLVGGRAVWPWGVSRAWRGNPSGTWFVSSEASAPRPWSGGLGLSWGARMACGTRAGHGESPRASSRGQVCCFQVGCGGSLSYSKVGELVGRAAGGPTASVRLESHAWPRARGPRRVPRGKARVSGHAAALREPAELRPALPRGPWPCSSALGREKRHGNHAYSRLVCLHHLVLRCRALRPSPQQRCGSATNCKRL